MAATTHMLNHVGFSPRQAALLTAYAGKTDRQVHQAGFSTHQMRVLRTGTWTLGALLKGGFTLAQAKLMLTLGA